MKENYKHKKLNVVVIGMTDRPQSINAALGILNQSRHQLAGVVFEKRFARRATSLKFYLDLIRKFSWNFLKSRIKELIKLKLSRISTEESLQNKLAREGAEYHEVSHINGSEAEAICKELAPDVIILAGAPIVKSNILNCASDCSINVHRSLLPKYAGLDAIFWALYHEEDQIGATVHTVTEDIDAGEIILQEEKEVGPLDDVESLTSWYNERVPGLLVTALDLISDPEFEPIKQDFSRRTYYSWPTKQQRQELEEKLKEKRQQGQVVS